MKVLQFGDLFLGRLVYFRRIDELAFGKVDEYVYLEGRYQTNLILFLSHDWGRHRLDEEKHSWVYVVFLLDLFPSPGIVGPHSRKKSIF